MHHFSMATTAWLHKQRERWLYHGSEWLSLPQDSEAGLGSVLALATWRLLFESIMDEPSKCASLMKTHLSRAIYSEIIRQSCNWEALWRMCLFYLWTSANPIHQSTIYFPGEAFHLLCSQPYTWAWYHNPAPVQSLPPRALHSLYAKHIDWLTDWLTMFLECVCVCERNREIWLDFQLTICHLQSSTNSIQRHKNATKSSPDCRKMTWISEYRGIPFIYG